MLPGIKLFNLSGRVAVITGGSKGLGLAIAEGFASAGGTVVLVSRHREESQAAAANIARDYGIHAAGIENPDVTNQQQTEAMADDVIKRFGALDILVNSAGINIRGPIDGLSPEQFKQVMDINVTGTWLVSRAVTSHMKKANRGRIINLASAMGLVGVGNRTPVLHQQRRFRRADDPRPGDRTGNPFNITVNALCPGPFLTDMNKSIADTEDGKKFIVGATVLGRWGRLEEIQGSAIFLASYSDAGSYATGSMLSVDGGWIAR